MLGTLGKETLDRTKLDSEETYLMPWMRYFLGQSQVDETELADSV